MTDAAGARWQHFITAVKRCSIDAAATGMMRVHVILTESVRRSDEARSRALGQLQALGLRNVNARRLKRHGIATGDWENERPLASLRELPEVEDVSLDQQRTTS